jgi:DNA polymerase (family X)
MDNTRIGHIISETGRLLELRDGPTAESGAFNRGGTDIRRLPRPLAWSPPETWPEPIRQLAAPVRESVVILLEAGTLPIYEELRSSLAPGIVELLELPGFSAARVRLLRNRLGVESVEDLENVCQSNQVAALSEFDEASQAQMLEAVGFWRSNKDLHHLHTGWVTANPMLERIRNQPGIIRCSVTGCLRRWTETVPGISFLVSATDTATVMEFFVSQPEVGKVTDRESTTVSVILKGGLRATLRVVSDRMFPFALARYTGNSAHYQALSARARDRGLELDEYGLRRADGNSDDPATRIRCHGEEDIYYALDLDFIPPELREDTGEFAAAEKHELPPLLEWTALRGSLHNHSAWSDGRQTLEDMAADAYEMGFSYWAVTDHSVSDFVGKGLKEKQVIAQINEIELVNQQYQDAERPFRLLSGLEVDIKTGGRLDFEDGILAQLDVVVASIHQGLSGNEAEMTRRLIAAAENRNVQIIGHLTGRMLLQRDGYRVNQRAVIDACAETGTWIELNASPWRLDMDWRLWRYAKEKGAKCVINTNSHRAEHGQYLRFGAHIARKGWLTKHDVVNTLPLKHLRDALLEKRLRR